MRFVRHFVAILFALSFALALRAQSTTPVLSQALPAQSLAPNAAAVTVDLRNYFALPGVTGPVAQVDTVLGKFNLELFQSDTPLTVANFQGYINAGRYANTLVHRSVTNFVIQMGGYVAVEPYPHIATFPTVQNEFKRSNVRGTVAMAKLGGDPNSATSEWFVNLADNSTTGAALDSQNGGFTVFARVIGSGMTVVDAIAALPVFNGGGAFDTIPLRNVQPGQTGVLPANLIVVTSVAVVPLYPAAAGGVAVLGFNAASSNSAVITATLSGSTLILTPVANGSASITVTATDTNGSAASGTISVTVGGPVAPVILSQPTAQIRMASGTVNTVVFSVGASGSPAPNYQWRRNDVDVAGQTTATYVLANASDAQAGTFNCVVSNSSGFAISAASVLSFGPTTSPGRLINLSILTGLASGENMAMGTVIGGNGTNGTKALLARAAGPALAQLGVPGVLPDPTMTLNFTTPTPVVVVGTNDDWAGDASLASGFAAVGAFPYASIASKDAAMLRTSLATGKYTVQVSDAGTGSGTVIAELYDSTPDASFTAATPRLINVSVLKQIASGATLTAGFVVGGTTAKTVLVRAIGPGLAQFGVGGTMPDPRLTLFNASSVKIAENDNWGGDAQLTAAGGTVGAFAIGSATSKDAVLLLTLAPGNYSAQVTGTGDGGQALVEVYEVP